jgi:hypothetical protein
VPIYAFAPWRSKTREFGVAGNATALATVLLGETIGIRRLVQPIVVAQLPGGEVETPVLDTKTVGVVVVVVVEGETTTSTAPSG